MPFANATRWVGNAGNPNRSGLYAAASGDFDGDEATEIAFGSTGQTGWIVDGETPTGSAFARVEATLQAGFEEVTGVIPLGDLDADGADDFSTFGLFVGSIPLPPTLSSADAADYPFHATPVRRCDADHDGQVDLCTSAGVWLGPLDAPGTPAIGQCVTDGLPARWYRPLQGWDEAFVASTGYGSDREVLFTMAWEDAASKGLCDDAAARFWTIPRESYGANSTVADFNGDGVSDVTAAIHGPDVDPEDAGIYIIEGPGDPQIPTNLPDVRDAAIRLVIPLESQINTVTSGDLDGDGFQDLVYTTDNQVRVYRGPFAPGTYDLDRAATAFRADASAGSSLGFYSTMDVFDVDQDRQDDLIISDSRDDEAGEDAGKIYIVWSGGIGSGSRNDPL